jgi:uncharacterized delta-60 repeat protein
MYCIHWGFRVTAQVAPLALACLIGCGDDDNGDTPDGDAGSEHAVGGSKASAGGGGSKATAGKGGAAAGKGSSAGAGGGKAEDEDKPDDDATGSAAGKAAAGAGGKLAAGSGGAGGTGGAGGQAAPLPELANISGTLISSVNALGGVTYAADGKIYAVGDVNIVDQSKGTGDTVADKYRTSVTGHKVALLRFLANGKPDTSFGDQGKVIWEGPGVDATSMGVAETSDGSVVVDVNLKYPSKRGGIALVKFDATGKLVTTFGEGGRKDIILGWTDADLADYPKATDGTAQFPVAQSWDIKTSDGGTKLVVFAHEPAAHGKLDTGVTPAVQRIDNDRYIVRVNASDGAFDSTFNAGAPVAVNTPNDGAAAGKPRFPSDGSRHGIVEADGAIVSSGYTGYADDKGNQIVLIRVKNDGTLDAAFHKERAGQPVVAGLAVFNPVPEVDLGFAECYGVVSTSKGYVTTGYGKAFGGTEGKSTLGYFPSTQVDMVSTRFNGTDVDTSYGRTGVFAAQSEALGDNAVSITEDRGRSSLIVLADNRVIMGGRFGQYPALYVVTDKGQFDTKISGKRNDTKGILLFPTLTSEKQPATSMFYGLALSPDGKHVAAGTNNHEQGALFTVLEVKDDGTLAAVAN